MPIRSKGWEHDPDTQSVGEVASDGSSAGYTGEHFPTQRLERARRWDDGLAWKVQS
jgi:hypothetical protein